jgi:hypothetical protein
MPRASLPKSQPSYICLNLRQIMNNNSCTSILFRLTSWVTLMAWCSAIPEDMIITRLIKKLPFREPRSFFCVHKGSQVTMRGTKSQISVVIKLLRYSSWNIGNMLAFVIHLSVTWYVLLSYVVNYQYAPYRFRYVPAKKTGLVILDSRLLQYYISAQCLCILRTEKRYGDMGRGGLTPHNFLNSL